MNRLSRREFLQATGAGLVATSPVVGLTQMATPAGSFSDYRALVCVFLFGGNDSFNMLVPRSDAEYNVYSRSRQNLAIDRSALLPISPLIQDGAHYGLHPNMGAIQTLFDSARVAFVTNVGPLIEPTTKEQYENGSVALPPRLFSHNDQQAQWQSLRGREPGKTGWAGRVGDLLRRHVSDQQLATNVSLAGNQLFQAADETVAYTMGRNGPIPFTGMRGDAGRNPQRRAVFQRILGADYDTIYERAYRDIQQRAVETVDRVNAALENAQPLSTAMPSSRLGQQLSTVARLISVREQLNMQRQIFFVSTGGFDSHDDQLVSQPPLLGDVSESIAAFYRATVELGVASSVTTFTQSDFGRTLTSNGDGTDHGWGGVQFVVGDAVRGRELYGRYPRLEIGGPDDVRRGRLIPSVSADQYAATLARWIGVPDEDLGHVAPHLHNFAQRDLGFLI
ncbi:MAG: DUF1501 domain-containing protein [Proteobacteria bacterium]|nr:DUF1501 domain-containing protein [Pseudomonadota bacterium]MYJ97201.1 DUF1501 domain-containing protein [Pseudomonadota bacterium]